MYVATKKILLSSGVIIAFVLYSIHGRTYTPVLHISAAASPTTATGKATQGNNMQGSPTSLAPSSASPTTTSTSYKNGRYTGSVADAVYGSIQVRATVTSGKITAVDFLQYPNDRRNSIEINTQAMPLLSQEAIAAQSAQVDGVSGATDTSQAFIESLSAALDKAKA